MAVVPRKITPTVRLRRLAAELRTLRADAEVTREAVAQHTGIDMATLYRIETAKARPQNRTLKALLNMYGADTDHQENLVALSKESTKQGWLQPYHQDLPEEYTAFISFEDEAAGLRAYESLVVPGLLQTEDYARAVIKGCLPSATDQQVDDRVQARLARKNVLTKPSPLQMWAIVDQAALHRVVGSRDIMFEQLNQLAAANDTPNITLQILPFEAGAHPGIPGSFMMLDFADPMDAELIYVDSMAGELILESEAEIRRYGLMFDTLRALALSPDQSSEMIIRLNRNTT